MSDPATPQPAATILMLRDGDDGLEVFMVVRHHQIDDAGYPVSEQKMPNPK